MLFRTRDGTFKDPETIVLLNAVEHFSRMSWDDKGISIHGIKDITKVRQALLTRFMGDSRLNK